MSLTIIQKVSVSALGTPDKDGFLTKQGGAIKTWKKRWFVLKGDTLYYFKTQKVFFLFILTVLFFGLSHLIFFFVHFNN